MFLKELSKKLYHFNMASRSLYFRILSGRHLLGKEFDTYGRSISFEFLRKGDMDRFCLLFCNPVSIVRYFEFDFAHRAVKWSSIKFMLDVSSPRLFMLYLLYKYTDLNLEAINPDENDLQETFQYLQCLHQTKRIKLSSCLANKLPYADDTFEVVSSISVVEHISDNDDVAAVKELFRVLKPGGKLILTIPCAKTFMEEWRDRNPYGLLTKQNGRKYFFQRFYDDNTISARISNIIGCSPLQKKIFGEKVKGTYFEYEKRWLNRGLHETIKDPYHIVKDYQLFAQIEDLPGMGVCGLVYQKGNH